MFTSNARLLTSILVLFIVAFMIRLPVSAQQIEFFKPPLTRVEFSNYEPLPTSERSPIGYMAYAGGAGPGMLPEGTKKEWVLAPLEIHPYINLLEEPKLWQFGACPFSDDEVRSLNVSLVSPSGTALQNAITWKIENECVALTPAITYGMEMGAYSLTLKFRTGTITHRYTVKYPSTPTIGWLSLSTSKRAKTALLLGFRKDTALEVEFYYPASLDMENADFESINCQLIGVRSIPTDSTGSAAIEITTTRSSPFDLNYIFPLVKGYEYVTQSSEQDIDKPNLLSYNVRPIAGRASSLAGGADTTKTCAGFQLPSRLKIGMQARVTPGGLANLINSKPARPSLDPSSKTVGRIPASGIFTVLDGPVCTHNILWWKVDYKGTQGWTGEGEGKQYWVEPTG